MDFSVNVTYTLRSTEENFYAKIGKYYSANFFRLQFWNFSGRTEFFHAERKMKYLQTKFLGYDFQGQ